MANKSDKSFPGRYTWILSSYFRLGYYLLYVPFKLEKDQQTGQFKIHRNKFQMLMCVLSFCLYFAFTPDYLRTSMSSLLERRSGVGEFDGKSYFSLMAALTFALRTFCLGWVFWRKQSSIAAMSNIMETSQFKFLNRVHLNGEHGTSSKFKGRILLLTTCILLTILSTLTLIWPEGVMNTVYTSHWLNVTLGQAKRTLLYTNEEYNCNVETALATDYLLLIVYLALQISTTMRDYCGVLFMLCGCLTLWQLCRDYKRSMDDVENKQSQRNGLRMSPSGWFHIYHDYKRLKRVSHMVNEIYSVPFLVYLCELMLFVPTQLEEVFKMVGFSWSRIELLIFLLLQVTGILISAELCAKVQSLKKLALREDLPFQLPGRQMLFIIQEADNYQHVSMKGAGFLQLTYRLLGEMMRTITIYFLTVAESGAKIESGAGVK